MADEQTNITDCCDDAACGDGITCTGSCSHRSTNRSQKMKSSLISRLNRIEGQVRGVKGMIEKDAYCDDVLNQIAAVQSAMKSVSRLLLENHMKTCISNRLKSGETDVIDEFMLTIEKMMK